MLVGGDVVAAVSAGEVRVALRMLRNSFQRIAEAVVVWSKYSNAQRVRSLHVSRIDADIEGREAA